MKMRTGLAGIGAAMVLTLGAQHAQAQTCPIDGGNGGGEQQIEVPVEGGGEPCNPGSSYTPFTMFTENANGVPYTITGEVENGDQYVQIGDVAEVEMNLDDITAALKADDKRAFAFAAAVGVRAPDSNWRFANAVYRPADARLTETEYRELANYMRIGMQNNGQNGGRVTGRSDPAPDRFTRYVDQVSQAFGRMMDSIGRNIPRIEIYSVTRKFNDRGVLMEEKESRVHIGGGGGG